MQAPNDTGISTGSAPDRYKTTEAGVVLFLCDLLRSGSFASIYGTPPVANWATEVPLPRGRADFVLYHVDGTLSVVETKAAGELRIALAGIGQILSYVFQLAARHGLHTNAIRGFLLCPTNPASEDCDLIEAACQRAGLQFFPVPTSAQLNDSLRILRAAQEG
jgi:hypothetical protein